MQANAPIEDLSFEEALQRLEQIVARMESGQIRLDELMHCFEQGAELVKLCNRRLDEIERRIELLTQRNGQEVAVPFSTEEVGSGGDVPSAS